MTDARVLQGDVLRFAAHYRGEKFHALLCDPPYELNFMGKHWDKSGISFRAETWAAFASLLHDGAFVMAFASARGWHRQAVAMEDAGLIIHPMIGWAYGSGFPKATRIANQPKIKDPRKTERIKWVDNYIAQKMKLINTGEMGDEDIEKALRVIEVEAVVSVPYDLRPITIDDKSTFSGHRYGLQALKPALEPILVAQKPYAGKPRERIVETGAGALWIDGGRVGVSKSDIESVKKSTRGKIAGMGYVGNFGIIADGEPVEYHPAGRWPANLVLSHSPSCGDECAPDCAVRMLGEQSGESVSKNGGKSGTNPNPRDWGRPFDYPRISPSDSGTPPRFFYNADWVAEQLEVADSLFYAAKAGRKERDAGLDGMPELMGSDISGGGGVNHEKADAYQARKTNRRNSHPTIKPISLTRHLATLLLPPVKYAPRRLFVPFSGAGSEMIGALQAGWECIVGVEGEREYVDIGRKRLAYWAAYCLALRWG